MRFRIAENVEKGGQQNKLLSPTGPTEVSR